MTVKDRFLRYVQVDTQSDPKTGEHPSTKKQFDLAKMLVQELTALGAQNVRLDERCYVYAELPASEGYENVPAIGFIAHVDTEPVCSGTNVKPRCVLYKGGDIVLANGKKITVEEFPFLEEYIGQEIIVTGGDTLLGADDKAGVAEIMSAVAFLTAHPEIKHGKVGVAFTPDEEIGEGADGFDVKGFGCDYAYTIDGGGGLGEIGYETFNAAEAVIKLTGKNIHPGAAKGKMINCALIAGEFLSALPSDEIPEKTEGHEGFYHVEEVKAEVEWGEIALIIRDHDGAKFEARKAFIDGVCKNLQAKYGDNAVAWKIREQYRNCLEKIAPHFHLIENARKACVKLGLTPYEEPVRGGTDGSTLSFMGLPCPNLFTGGHNAHSVLEFAVVESMEKATQVILEIISLYAKA